MEAVVRAFSDDWGAGEAVKLRIFLALPYQTRHILDLLSILRQNLGMYL